MDIDGCRVYLEHLVSMEIQEYQEEVDRQEKTYEH